MINKYFSKFDQAGDTIVEVMIVLAVLSLSFGISYATANKGLNQSINAQQHSQALGYLNSQVEDLRLAVANGDYTQISSAGSYFCMMSINSTYQPTPIDNGGFGVPSSANADAQDDYKEYSPTSACIISNLYHVSINQASANQTSYGGDYITPAGCTSGSDCTETSFTFMVRWNGLGGLGPQQESLTYRIGSTPSILGLFQSPQQSQVQLPPIAVSSATYSGNSYGYCVNGESDGGTYSSDGANGCFTAATAPNGTGTDTGDTGMFAFRQIFVAYSFTPTSGSFKSNALSTTLTLKYRQYPYENGSTSHGSASVPSDYTAFDLLVCAITPSQASNMQANPQAQGSGSTVNNDYDCYRQDGSNVQAVSLPVSDDSSQYNWEPQSVNILNYQSGDYIEIDWINNTGTDPNLEIDTLQLSQQQAQD